MLFYSSKTKNRKPIFREYGFFVSDFQIIGCLDYHNNLLNKSSLHEKKMGGVKVMKSRLSPIPYSFCFIRMFHKNNKLHCSNIMNVEGSHLISYWVYIERAKP